MVTGPLRAEASLESACGRATVQLEAEGTAPCLRVTPSLRFSPAERTCGSVLGELEVENTCDSAVSFQSLAVEEAADGADAWCAGGVPCREIGVVSAAGAVAPRTSRKLSVRFTPANVGEVTGVLRAVAREGDGEIAHAVALSGTGLPRATVTERFPPLPVPRGDVLVVLDTSPSMAARRASVESNLRNFGKYLRLSQVDAQVTVTTAEREGAGATVGTVTSTAADFEQQLGRLVSSAPRSTEDTSCLVPALAVLGAQPGVRRPGVPLAIICVTDSPDRAPGAWQPLMARLPARDATPTVHVVGPFLDGSACTEELDDGRLESLVRETNGVRESICVPDWERALENLGREFFGAWYLALLGQPALRVTEVSTDGVVLQPRDWSFDAALNAVKLNFPLVHELSVTYEPRCR